MTEYVAAALRRRVRERAGNRCEYCLLPEDAAFFPHEPDHIIAVKHDGDTTSRNLALACLECNRYKGTDIASIDPSTGDVVRLFNPRGDRWSVHFGYERGVIFGLTPEGRATKKLLRFNLRERIETRQFLFAAERWRPH